MKNTLVFDVKNIQDSVFNNHEIEVSASQLAFNIADIQFVSPVRGDIQLLRHSETSIYVKAEVSVKIEMQCGKCLEPFKIDVFGTFEIQFTPVNNPENIESGELEGEERYYDGETFDISEDTRQALVLQMPVWPLCSQDCEGLCAVCGTNLNDEHCNCEDTDDFASDTQHVNSPFAELPQLLASTKLENEPKSKNHKEMTSKNGTSKT